MKYIRSGLANTLIAGTFIGFGINQANEAYDYHQEAQKVDDLIQEYDLNEFGRADELQEKMTDEYERARNLRMGSSITWFTCAGINALVGANLQRARQYEASNLPQIARTDKPIL
jgi:hypothetical protein